MHIVSPIRQYPTHVISLNSFWYLSISILSHSYSFSLNTPFYSFASAIFTCSFPHTCYIRHHYSFVYLSILSAPFSWPWYTSLLLHLFVCIPFIIPLRLFRLDLFWNYIKGLYVSLVRIIIPLTSISHLSDFTSHFSYPSLSLSLSFPHLSLDSRSLGVAVGVLHQSVFSPVESQWRSTVEIDI